VNSTIKYPRINEVMTHIFIIDI